MRGAVAGSVFLAVFLAGCIEAVGPVEPLEPDGPIKVPGFGWGETWTSEHSEGRAPLRYSVSPAPTFVPDRFGLMVTGGTITSPDGLPRTAFALDENQLLWDGGHTHDDWRAHDQTGECERGSVISEYHFSLDAIPADWGTLRGKTLETGDRYTFTRLRSGQLSGDDSSVHEEIKEFTVTAKTWAHSPSDNRVVDAIFVSVTGWRQPIGGEPVNTKWTAEHVYVDGVGEPVTVRGDDVTLTLKEYSSGTGPIAFGNETNPNHLASKHPSATFEVPGLTPDFSGLPLEFPIGDALEAIRRSPAAATAAAWLATNQNVWTESAVYERLPGSVKWRFTFSDEEDGIYATATRTFGVDSHQDTASSGLAYETNEPRPRPIVPVVDAATALKTATAFDPKLEHWTVMEWRTQISISSLRPNFAFTHASQGDCTNAEYRQGRIVDATTGALAPGNYHGPM
ncbi:MAG TPA: hypothetical protein VGB18_06380 [Candidatus Thermoplasmatota archaeon]